jgi:ribonucleoside-triphosphate reductase
MLNSRMGYVNRSSPTFCGARTSRRGSTTAPSGAKRRTTGRCSTTTPAEATSYRLAKLDGDRFPHARFAIAESKSPFYTNSTQLPVDYTDDVFEVLDLQDEIQSRFTGGTVQHLFFGERIQDPEAVKQFIKKVFGKYKMPYLSVTPTFSVCPECGYIDGEHASCPKCGSECEVYSRVVGYLRPVRQWNQGKREEFAARRMLTL